MSVIYEGHRACDWYRATGGWNLTCASLLYIDGRSHSSRRPLTPVNATVRNGESNAASSSPSIRGYAKGVSQRRLHRARERRRRRCVDGASQARLVAVRPAARPWAARVDRSRDGLAARGLSPRLRHHAQRAMAYSCAAGSTGCSTETGSDAGKVFLRASSSAFSCRLRSRLPRAVSSRRASCFGSAIISTSSTKTDRAYAPAKQRLNDVGRVPSGRHL